MDEKEYPESYTLKRLMPQLFKDLEEIEKQFGIKPRAVIMAAIEEKIPQIFKTKQLYNDSQTINREKYSQPLKQVGRKKL